MKIRGTDWVRERGFATALSLALVCYWLVFHWPSMGYYWNNDDLHLIRRFSLVELGSSFRSTWDPDGIETPGFRLFTVLFNHCRAVVFGESPTAQRLFLVALGGILIWLVARLSQRFALPRSGIALSLVLLVSSKSFSGDLIWISDGVHILQWALCAGSLLLFLDCLDRRRLLPGVLSLFVARVLDACG